MIVNKDLAQLHEQSHETMKIVVQAQASKEIIHA